MNVTIYSALRKHVKQVMSSIYSLRNQDICQQFKHHDASTKSSTELNVFY